MATANPNPVRILIQRVLVDMLAPEGARTLAACDMLAEPLYREQGFRQTFETRITLACTDDAEDLPATAYVGENVTLRVALVHVASYHYGQTGAEAVQDILATFHA